MEHSIDFSGIAKSAGTNLITWKWVKSLLHWLIISAGTVSECAFLIASLWMSVNASVHALVLLVMSDTASQRITELATAAYVALPELILGLAVVTTIGHVRLFLYNRQDYKPLIWAILFGLPTIIFLLLSLITLGCSVLSVNFRMPEPLIVVRAIAGYWYAFTSLLYTQLGVPQEKDRLSEKDTLITTLRQEKDVTVAELQRKADAMLAAWNRERAGLEETIRRQSAEMEEQKTLLSESKNAQMELIKAMQKTSESALQGYSDVCLQWLKSGVKTVSIDELSRYTGHSKRKIQNAITAGNLQTAPRNRELILVSSLAQWLAKTPAPEPRDEQETDALAILNIESIRQETGMQNGHGRVKAG